MFFTFSLARAARVEPHRLLLGQREAYPMSPWSHRGRRAILSATPRAAVRLIQRRRQALLGGREARRELSRPSLVLRFLRTAFSPAQRGWRALRAMQQRLALTQTPYSGRLYAVVEAVPVLLPRTLSRPVVVFLRRPVEGTFPVSMAVRAAQREAAPAGMALVGASTRSLAARVAAPRARPAQAALAAWVILVQGVAAVVPASRLVQVVVVAMA
jgi:hypothetical protein